MSLTQQSTAPGPGRTAWRILRQLLEHIVIEPVRTGRIRRLDWPPGLIVSVGVGLFCYLTAMVIGVAAPWLRATLPSPHSALGFPSAAVVALLALLLVISALAVSASWHAPWPLRVAGLILPLTLLAAPASDATSPRSGLVAGASWLVVAGVTAWRWRRPYRWWEFCLAVLLLAAPTVAIFVLTAGHRAMPGYTIDDLVAMALIAVGVFAIPITMVAGVAVSEVSFSTSAWLVETVSRQVPRRLTGSLVAALAVLGAVLAAESWRRPTLPWRLHLLSLATAAGVLTLAAVGWLVADRLADRRAGPGSTRLPRLVPPVRRIAIVLSILIALPTIVLLGLQLLQLGSRMPLIAVGVPAHWVSSPLLNTVTVDDTRLVSFALATAVAVILGLRAAHRGRRGPAELGLVMAVLCAERTAHRAGVGAPLSLDVLSTLAVAVTISAGLICLVARAMSARRVEAFGVALLLSLALRFRDLFSDPLGLVLGGAGGALLVLGLIWNLLTNAEEANGDSDRFPRPARVLAVVAGLSLAMVFYAFNAFAAGTDAGLGLETWTTTGAEVFGTGLLLAGLLAVLAAAWRNDEVVEPGARHEQDPISRAHPPGARTRPSGQGCGTDRGRWPV